MLKDKEFWKQQDKNDSSQGDFSSETIEGQK